MDLDALVVQSLNSAASLFSYQDDWLVPVDSETNSAHLEPCDLKQESLSDSKPGPTSRVAPGPHARDFDEVQPEEACKQLKKTSRILSYYNHVKDLPPPGKRKEQGGVRIQETMAKQGEAKAALTGLGGESKALIKASGKELFSGAGLGLMKSVSADDYTKRPTWHPPWEMMAMISGHLGWVRCISVDPTNSWFATGSADRTIKIWDLARHELKLTLTGHVAAVRSVVASERHPYLFSSGEDQKLICWDLECNKAIRQYFGHRSGIYSISLHPELDLLVSGSRDRSVCVWDMRTRAAIHTFVGHESTVFCVATQASEPQVISGSSDCTVKYWDLVAGQCYTTLTHHKKSVRALVLHPRENAMATGAADALKKFAFPHGNFIHNFPLVEDAIINSLAINHDGVMVAGSAYGTLNFYDWKSAHQFQAAQTIPQPGSLPSEAGFFDTAFDKTGSRLITAELDKTIKIWREVPDATPENYPLNWKPKRKRVAW
ncbi:uncharacterized protein LOC126318247 [Schistocerca gregaria]|uniref:uncharacterized protein LOC126318247 n=1 Tax=Schistocerca gregaria TaxID=7010 RepID=UPI00211E97CD|nr:uncharacterized protein LOC126318247 [Schistocerca gregaria]